MKNYIRNKVKEYLQDEKNLLNQFKKMELIILNTVSDSIGYRQALTLTNECFNETSKIRSQIIPTHIDDYLDIIETNVEALDFDENFFLNIKNPWLRLYNHILALNMEQAYSILEEIEDRELKDVYFSNLFHYRVIQSFFEFHQDMTYSMTDDYLETYYSVLYNFPGIEENSPLTIDLEKWLNFNERAYQEYLDYEKKEISRIVPAAIKELDEIELEQYIGVLMDLCLVSYYMSYMKLAEKHFTNYELSEIVRENISEIRRDAFVELFLGDKYIRLKNVKQ